jgi:tetratricopeptide (TPR) repeat protein
MRKSLRRLFCLLTLALLHGAAYCAQPLVAELPPKPPAGWFQALTPAFVVETDVSKAYTDKVATMIRNAEMKFYKLFSLTPDLMNGVSKQKFDNKYDIPGDVLKFFRPYIEVRVFKDMEKFSDEWFDEIGVKDKQQRLKQGIPGAWTGGRQDYDKGKHIRVIRSFVANRDDDEVERTLLHEMGHLFVTAYLLEYSGAPPPGKENQKRGTPAWLGEGMAQLFENLWSNAASAKKARLRQQAMMYEAVNLGDCYPFGEFTSITNAHNLQAVASDPLRSTLNYAQSASVMDYMVNVDGARFFQFLQNLRILNFERNLNSRDPNHVSELFSFQNEAFKKAFNFDISQIEATWKKNVKDTMEKQLKSNPEYYYWIGEYYLRRGKDKASDIVNAEKKFNLAMTQAPKKGEGYLGMGRMAIRKKDNAAAATLLTQAVALMPNDDDAWYYHGIALVNTGKAGEAVESFNKSLKIFPRSDRALSGLAQAAFHTKQYDKAIDAYEQAYQCNRDPYHMYLKGRAAFFAKKYREAQSCFARFVEIYPQDAQGVLWYGLAAWRLGDKDFAKQKIKESLKLVPEDEIAKSALELALKDETIRFEREDPDAPAPGAGKPGEKTAVKNAGKAPEPVLRIDDE